LRSADTGLRYFPGTRLAMPCVEHKFRQLSTQAVLRMRQHKGRTFHGAIQQFVTPDILNFALMYFLLIRRSRRKVKNNKSPW